MIKSILKNSNHLFVKPYTKYVYISPSFEDSYAMMNQPFVNELQALVEPVPMSFLSEIPNIPEVISQNDSQHDKTLFIIDDFNEELWNSKSVRFFTIFFL